MMRLFENCGRVVLPALVWAITSAALPGGVSAQSAAPPVTNEQPQPRLSERERLDRLFERLKAAPTVEAATAISNQIEQRFDRSGSDTADLLMQRVKQAIESKNFETALDLLDYITTLTPDWAEAYHRRALIHFIAKDEEAAMRDIRATLAREPRHYQALAGLGRLLQMMGKRRQAYEVYQRALLIHPHFQDLKKLSDALKTEAEGQPI
jgi:tetratricopeptide (TPR) repeat protein